MSVEEAKRLILKWRTVGLTKDEPGKLPEATRVLADALEASQRRVLVLEGIVDGLTPRPIKDHPNYFEDGDTYLLMVPVIDRFERRHYEHHIVSVSCDSETPVTFKDQNSDSWDAWEWDDAEFYIKNPKYPEPKSIAATVAAVREVVNA